MQEWETAEVETSHAATVGTAAGHGKAHMPTKTTVHLERDEEGTSRRCGLARPAATGLNIWQGNRPTRSMGVLCGPCNAST